MENKIRIIKCRGKWEDYFTTLNLGFEGDEKMSETEINLLADFFMEYIPCEKRSARALATKISIKNACYVGSCCEALVKARYQFAKKHTDIYPQMRGLDHFCYVLATNA